MSIPSALSTNWLRIPALPPILLSLPLSAHPLLLFPLPGMSTLLQWCYNRTYRRTWGHTTNLRCTTFHGTLWVLRTSGRVVHRWYSLRCRVRSSGTTWGYRWPLWWSLWGRWPNSVRSWTSNRGTLRCRWVVVWEVCAKVACTDTSATTSERWKQSPAARIAFCHPRGWWVWKTEGRWAALWRLKNGPTSTSL